MSVTCSLLVVPSICLHIFAAFSGFSLFIIIRSRAHMSCPLSFCNAAAKPCGAALHVGTAEQVQHFSCPGHIYHFWLYPCCLAIIKLYNVRD